MLSQVSLSYVGLTSAPTVSHKIDIARDGFGGNLFREGDEAEKPACRIDSCLV